MTAPLNNQLEKSAQIITLVCKIHYALQTDAIEPPSPGFYGVGIMRIGRKMPLQDNRVARESIFSQRSLIHDSLY
jgi:hypothetical protein